MIQSVWVEAEIILNTLKYSKVQAGLRTTESVNLLREMMTGNKGKKRAKYKGKNGGAYDEPVTKQPIVKGQPLRSPSHGAI